MKKGQFWENRQKHVKTRKNGCFSQKRPFLTPGGGGPPEVPCFWGFQQNGVYERRVMGQNLKKRDHNFFHFDQYLLYLGRPGGQKSRFFVFFWVFWTPPDLPVFVKKLRFFVNF